MSLPIMIAQGSGTIPNQIARQVFPGRIRKSIAAFEEYPFAIAPAHGKIQIGQINPYFGTWWKSNLDLY